MKSCMNGDLVSKWLIMHIDSCHAGPASRNGRLIAQRRRGRGVMLATRQFAEVWHQLILADANSGADLFSSRKAAASAPACASAYDVNHKVRAAPLRSAPC